MALLSLLLTFPFVTALTPMTPVSLAVVHHHMVETHDFYHRQNRLTALLQSKNPYHASYNPRVTVTKTSADPANITTVINRLHVLPATYSPSDLVNVQQLIPHNPYVYLRWEALQAWRDLANTIYDHLQLRILVRSGYRSFATQQSLFARYVRNVGYQHAVTFSAKAGQSEHQSGLALDLEEAGYSMLVFHRSAAYAFMRNYAHLYGFTLSYPEQRSIITSYMYEPWHWRYVGVELATYLFNHQVTLNEVWIRQKAQAIE